MTGIEEQSQEVDCVWWKRISIRYRLQFSLFGLALLMLVVTVISVSWLVHDNFHHKARQDLQILANVLADNSRAALAFNDPKSATKVLGALNENPHIEQAAIYQNGKLFAVYPTDQNLPTLEAVQASQLQWPDVNYYVATAPIAVGEQVLGSLIVKTNLNEWNDIQFGLIKLFIVLFVFLLLVTLALSWWLKVNVTHPLKDLSDWALKVSRNKDFSLRISKRSGDEVGMLVDSLNSMINELSQQKHILSFNRRLQNEIVEREKVEKDLINMRNRAEAASEAKSRFLANMSHEIRTPMNAIIGFVDVLLDMDVTDQQRSHLDTVRRSAKLLHRLLNDILDVAKMEQGKLVLEHIPFRLQSLLGDVVKTFEVNAREKGLLLSLKISDGLSENYLGDPLRLNQILVNLVGNAIKFTESGAVVITVKPAADNHVHFAIRDTGIGIPKDKLGVIFANFAQADTSISRTHGGSGLGTTISKQLVGLMDGEIWVESELGVGSTFHCEIPLVETDQQPEASVAKRIASSPVQGLRILLAEDVAENAELIRIRLEEVGHQVTHVWNGQQALEKFAGAEFDMVLMDVQMPVMDGLTAARELRKQTRGQKVPILALTASVMEENRMACRAAGMNGFVGKPVVIDELFKEMSALMSGKSAAIEPPGADKSPEKAWFSDIEVAPFNVRKAQSNWRKKEVFLRSLQSFIDRLGPDMSAVKRALENEDLNEVRKILHALKGVAGNLALEDCYQALHHFNIELKAEDTDYKTGFTVANKAVQRCIHACDALLEVHPPPQISLALEVDVSLVREHVQELDQKLGLSQFDAELVEQTAKLLSAAGVNETQVNKVVKNINDFDFEKARKALQEASMSLPH
ncbi:response regulator receiver-modulated signal transduction histidine kinase/phosphotransferase [Oleiphilus messinensis]|uniref:histidine kinase n=1 Tax=Oleiphilus messinensis TaxID=141451 RepID=A0A1Y0IE18_9GAMM|nr:ATP-binding protein [Oleiphilus messinensis]ARU58026.1 response regulator receiver-modulated signal transduction histidine kinase/phosphotransferase [Oleiphilus messinensis]